MPLNDPVPSSALDVLKRNSEDFDKLVNSDDASVTNRVGKAALTVAEYGRRLDSQVQTGEQQLNDFSNHAQQAINSTGWFVVGDFATGFEFTSGNQVGTDENGNQWSYNGSLPFTVPAGTVPSQPDYTNRGDAAVRQDFQKGKLRSTNYTTERTKRRAGLNSHGLQLTTENVRPVVSFIDDDGAAAFLSKLKPIFDSKNIKTALAIYTDGPDNNSSTMTWEQILNLYSEGYEIMSHTHTNLNLTGATTTQAEYEFSQSRFELESRGIDVESFVYVMGVQGSRDVRELVRKYFRSAYITLDDGVQPKPLQDWFVRRKNAVAQTIESNPSIEELKALVDYAEAHNEWAVFTTHAGYVGMTSEQQQVISDLIDYIQGKGIDILTPSKALDVHGSRFFAGTDDDERDTVPQRFTKIDKHGNMFPSGARFEKLGARDGNSHIDDFEKNVTTVCRPASSTSGLPDHNIWGGFDYELAGVLEIVHLYEDRSYGCMRFYPRNTDFSFSKTWNTVTEEWSEWVPLSSDGIYESPAGRDGNSPISEYRKNSTTTFRTGGSEPGWPSTGVYLVRTLHRYIFSTESYGLQTAYNRDSGMVFERVWLYSSSEWSEWVVTSIKQLLTVAETSVKPDETDAIIATTRFNSTTAANESMPENSAGLLVFYYGDRENWSSYQTYHIFRSHRMYHRFYDDQADSWSAWSIMSGGASGSFTTSDSKTVTVENGVITSIS